MGIKPEESTPSFIETNNLELLLANHVQAMLAYWDKNEVCLFANQAYLDWFGKSKEEIVGKMTMLDLFGPVIYNKNLAHIAEALKGNTQRFERASKKPSGEVINVIVEYYPDFIDGKVRGFFVHIDELNEVKTLEKNISVLEQKFRDLLEVSPDAIIITDHRGTVQLMNGQAEKLFGYTTDELLESSFFMLLPKGNRTKAEASWAKFISRINAKQTNPILQLNGLKKDGEKFPIEITVSKIHTENGINICASIRDVSELRELELVAKRKNEQNRIFIELAPTAIAMFDLDMCYLAASEKWVSDYKIKEKNIIGRSHYELFPEIGDDWKAIHQACLKGEINKCDEASFERADGTIQWVSWDIRPWYVYEDKIGGIIVYTADITHIKAKDLEKQKIEAILDRTNEVARIGTWELDLIMNKVTWSRVTKEIHEVEPEFIPQLEAGINFYREGKSRDTITHAITQAMTKGTPFDVEVELITEKGALLWTRVIGESELKNDKCVRIYGVFQDINKTKRAEESLHTLNEELSTIFNAENVSIIGTDTKGNITHFNKGAERLSQYSHQEMIGKQTPYLIHLEEEILQRGKELTALYGRKIEGFDALVEVPKKEVFESREWTYVKKDGTHLPVQLVVTAIRGADDELSGFLGVGTDISAIKDAEKELKSVLDITIDQNGRLRNFAHIISHNLRSHTGNLDMVLDLYIQENKGIDQNEYIQLLLTSLNNLKETIANLNEVVLMNNSTENLVPLNLYNIIEATTKSISQLASSASVEIRNEVDKTTTILGIPAYAESVILNFITNGIKYRSYDRPSLVTFSVSYLKDFLVLKIEDNGIGIDLKKNRAKLFGMYKTFNGNKDARGIGLFITKNQVEAMGGKIEVESELNKGTIFKIYMKYEKN